MRFKRLRLFAFALLPIALLTTAVAAPASAAPAVSAPTVALDFMSEGWSYQEVPFDGIQDFQEPAYDDQSWTVGRAGFGTVEGRCSWNNTSQVSTPWTPGTDLLLRRDVEIPVGATGVHLSGTIDNNADVYVNGFLIQHAESGFCGPGGINADVPTSVLGQQNVVAIRARDLGDAAYVDLQITYATSDLNVCVGEGAGGWKFRATVSENDGLVLEGSSFQGRVYTKSVSAPYLDGRYSVAGQRRVARLELTAEPAGAHPGIVGSKLVNFTCVGSGDADIYARAEYQVNDFMFGSGKPGGLTVIQEYRFRGIDLANPCEPTEKFSCARFWPSLTFKSSDARECVSPARARPNCTLFVGLRSVQRMEFLPDGKENGAINAFRDQPRPGGFDGDGVVAGVTTKGNGGSMKYEDSDTAIRNGGQGDWDSLHQSPTNATSNPGINPFSLSPGCGACAHMHWVWRKIVNNIDRNPMKDFTDGKPQILDGSRQNAEFGIVRLEASEVDPVIAGWRSLIDKKGDSASLLRGHTPVVFWEMTSDSASDAAFPVLDNYRHGGNGALFFGGAAH